jgi:hypothetical protein
METAAKRLSNPTASARILRQPHFSESMATALAKRDFRRQKRIDAYLISSAVSDYKDGFAVIGL